MNSSFVIDASVAVKWFIPEIDSENALLVLKDDAPMFAPELIFPEFGNIIWKKARIKELKSKLAQTIIDKFLEFPIETIESQTLLRSAYKIAEKTQTTVYDCLYLSAAITQDCPMLTADKKFYNTISKTSLHGNIQLLSNYRVPGSPK